MVETPLVGFLFYRILYSLYSPKSAIALNAMYCPMQLDCQSMTGIIHNCPNVKQCLENSPLDRKEALRLYFLNLGVNPEDINIQTEPLNSSFIFSLFPPRQSFNYNRDYATRDTIIFGSPIDWQNCCLSGIHSFEALTVDQLQELLDRGFADPTERQNFSPTIGELFQFGQSQKIKGFDWTFQGYVVSPNREDYRVSIDGIEWRGDACYQIIADFEVIAQNADELNIEPDFLRAWWD